jgi:hypothetical protein
MQMLGQAQRIPKDKHTSLLAHSVCCEEKNSTIALTPVASVMNLFFFVTYEEAI